jgi:hypothetical protein
MPSHSKIAVERVYYDRPVWRNIAGSSSSLKWPDVMPMTVAGRNVGIAADKSPSELAIPFAWMMRGLPLDP